MRRRDYLFLIASGFLLLIIGPYLYLTNVVYAYIHQHAPSEAGKDFTRMPQLADLWITFTSAVIIYTTMHAFEGAV